MRLRVFLCPSGLQNHVYVLSLGPCDIGPVTEVGVYVPEYLRRGRGLGKCTVLKPTPSVVLAYPGFREPTEWSRPRVRLLSL